MGFLQSINIIKGESLHCSVPNIFECNDFVNINVCQKLDELFLCTEDLPNIGTQIHPGML